jgi:hypothetical protein
MWRRRAQRVLLTPIAIAGNMYFSRFLTSGKPWCLVLSPSLAWRSMSSSSCPPLTRASGPSGAMPLPGSIGGGELSRGLGRSGDVSLGRGMFGAIVGSRVCDKRYTLRNDLNKADEYVQNDQNYPNGVL